MRKSVNFFLLIASVLVLIQGLRSEHAYCRSVQLIEPETQNNTKCYSGVKKNEVWFPNEVFCSKEIGLKTILLADESASSNAVHSCRSFETTNMVPSYDNMVHKTEEGTKTPIEEQNYKHSLIRNTRTTSNHLDRTKIREERRHLSTTLQAGTRCINRNIRKSKRTPRVNEAKHRNRISNVNKNARQRDNVRTNHRLELQRTISDHISTDRRLDIKRTYRNNERRNRVAERRSRNTERRTRDNERRSRETEMRTSDLERRIRKTERRNQNTIMTIRGTETRTRNTERRIRDNERRNVDSERRTRKVEERTRATERRNRVTETRSKYITERRQRNLQSRTPLTERRINDISPRRNKAVVSRIRDISERRNKNIERRNRVTERRIRENRDTERRIRVNRDTERRNRVNERRYQGNERSTRVSERRTRVTEHRNRDSNMQNRATQRRNEIAETRKQLTGERNTNGKMFDKNTERRIQLTLDSKARNKKTPTTAPYKVLHPTTEENIKKYGGYFENENIFTKEKRNHPILRLPFNTSVPGVIFACVVGMISKSMIFN